MNPYYFSRHAPLYWSETLRTLWSQSITLPLQKQLTFFNLKMGFIALNTHHLKQNVFIPRIYLHVVEVVPAYDVE